MQQNVLYTRASRQEMSNDEWRVYQRAMRSLASFTAFEVARRIPVPRGALHMLDLGGSHRYYSVMLCRGVNSCPNLLTNLDTGRSCRPFSVRLAQRSSHILSSYRERSCPKKHAGWNVLLVDQQLAPPP